MDHPAANRPEGHRLWGPVSPFLAFSIFLVVLIGVFGIVQFASPWLIGYDGAFHIKYSELLREQGVIDKLPWLKFTIHAEEYRDHHLLFHYLLIPFTLGDLNLGGKIATLSFAVALGLTIYFVYSRAGVRFAPLFALLTMLASAPYIYRISMLRVQSLSLALLLIVFYFAMRRRQGIVFLLSVVFVWYYDAYPLLLIVTGAFVLSIWLIHHELDLKVFAFTVLGILLGMVLNPYFPENFASIVYNVYRTLFLDVEGVKLGSEWAPYKTWALVSNSLPAFVALFATILALPLVKHVKAEEYAALCLNIVFLILTLKSRRFVEYWPVFSFLTAALLLGRRVPGKYLLPPLLLLVPLSIFNVKAAILEIDESPPLANYAGSATWLLENTKANEVVFNADWDNFPFLFFYNHHNHYILGLDPMYMLTFDEPKYRLYQKITKGKEMRPGRHIIEAFGARYVFLDKNHKTLYRRLLRDPQARKVFGDKGGYVFRLVSSEETKAKEKGSRRSQAPDVRRKP